MNKSWNGINQFSFFQRFEWEIDEPLKPGEVLIVQLLVRNFWGKIKQYGIYRLGLHLVTLNRRLHVADSLLDDENKPVSVSTI